MNTPEPSGENEPPGVPGLGTWGAVYIFVFVFFVLCVVVLALLSRAFA